MQTESQALWKRFSGLSLRLPSLRIIALFKSGYLANDLQPSFAIDPNIKLLIACCCLRR